MSAGAILFGKLPSHGDFIARGLDEAQAARLDDFLSASLSDAAMLDDFDELYGRAPAWRFVIELAGQAVCGVIAPSLDKVGRQFPIMAGVRAGGDLGLLLDACEAHLYEAFAGRETADELYARLSASPVLPVKGLPPPGWFLEDDNRMIVERLEGNAPPDLIRQMMEAARQVA